MFKKFLDPKNDLAFKRIFGSEKNKDILIHFLNDLFGRKKNPIETVTFLKTAQEPETASQRASIVDVLCEDLEGNQFIIEMQVDGEPGFEKRAQYYAAKTYIQQRDKGTAYKALKQVTFLAITNYILFPENKKYLSHHHILESETYEQHLKDFSFSFLELPKFKKEKDHLNTMTEKWAYFFKHAPDVHENDLEVIVGNDFAIKRAFDELNRFSWTLEELRSYDSVEMKRASMKAIMEGERKEGKEEGRIEGIIEGRIEGKKEGKLEIALVMLADGMDMETVTRVTGLSVEEIHHQPVTT